MYQIKRECYNEKTFNGYTDSPYWLIEFDYYKIGLKDNGTFWSIDNDIKINRPLVKEKLQIIIEECKLNITLK